MTSISGNHKPCWLSAINAVIAANVRRVYPQRQILIKLEPQY